MNNSPPPVKKIRRHSNKEERSFYDPNNLEFKIEQFQKEAIYRQLLEYKREAQKLESIGKENSSRREAREEQIGIVISELQLIYDQIESLLVDLGISEGLNRFDYPEILQLILDNQMETGDFKRKLGSQRSTTVINFNHIRTTISNLYKHNREFANQVNGSKDSQDKLPSIKSFLDIQSKLLNGVKDSTKSPQDLNEIDKLKEQVRFLQAKQKISDQEISTKTEQVEELNSKVKTLEKSTDRLRMELSKRSDEPIEEEVKNTEPEVINIDTDKILEEQKERFIKEIKQLREEKADLSSQLDIAKSKLHDIPEEIIKDSYIFRDLLVQLTHYEHKYEIELEENRALKDEIENLRKEKEESLDRYLNEEQIRKEIVEKELKKVMADVVRVRKHRDQLQTEVTTIKSREDLDFKEKVELRNIFSAQELRLKQINSEVQRLRKKVAYFNNDQDAIDYINEHPEILKMDDTLSRQAELEAENSNLKIKFNELMQSLNDSHNLDDFFKQNKELADKVSRLDEENSKLKEKAKLYEDQEKGALTSKIIELESELEKATKQKLFLESQEVKLQQEIEGLSSSNTHLTNTQLNKLATLKHKEEQLGNAFKEKAKCEQKMAQALRDNEQLNRLSSTLKKQSDNLQEYIRKLEEQGKSMAFQMKTMEREIKANAEIRNQMEERLKSISRYNNELKGQRTSLTEKIDELESSIYKKSHSLEDEVNENNRLKDEMVVLKEKITTLTSKPNRGNNDELETTLEEYKTLLKCTSCALRFKSHCLIRCMHVFCKECIDSRLETRQRKCPSCNESFGANDVRTIYL